MPCCSSRCPKIPALLLATLLGSALNEDHERSVLIAFSICAFIIATVAFVLMEQSSDKRMAWLVGQFTAFGIVPETTSTSFALPIRVTELRTAFGLTGATLAVANLLACS